MRQPSFVPLDHIPPTRSTALGVEDGFHQVCRLECRVGQADWQMEDWWPAAKGWLVLSRKHGKWEGCVCVGQVCRWQAWLAWGFYMGQCTCGLASCRLGVAWGLWLLAKPDHLADSKGSLPGVSWHRPCRFVLSVDSLVCLFPHLLTPMGSIGVIHCRWGGGISIPGEQRKLVLEYKLK